MKNIIYKLGLLLFVFTTISSCVSPMAETNYEPANYEFPGGISLASSNITNSSFDLTYTNSGAGDGFYVVVESGSPVPSNQDVFNESAAGQVTSGNFPLDGNPVVITVDDDLCDGTTFDVYAVQFTSDSFLSPTPVSITVTTVANSDDIVGIWDTVTNGYNGWFGIDVVDLVGIVTVTDNGDGTFFFDDYTGGWYSEFYSQYGAAGQSVIGPLQECNTFTFSYPSDFNGCCGDAITATTVFNFDGTLTVTWTNTFFEDSAVMVLTKR